MTPNNLCQKMWGSSLSTQSSTHLRHGKIGVIKCTAHFQGINEMTAGAYAKMERRVFMEYGKRKGEK